MLRNEEDLADLSRICHTVAGMPLALELAAAWVDMLSLSEIAEEQRQDYIESLNVSAELRAELEGWLPFLSDQEATQGFMKPLGVERLVAALQSQAEAEVIEDSPTLSSAPGLPESFGRYRVLKLIA